ncbi:MAG: elongation factor G [bacterium]
MAADLANLRNVALLGQTGSGKTSLTEAMIHLSGATNRLGTVEAKNTVMDFLEDEKTRQQSMSTAFYPVEYKGVRINVADCPGAMDFFYEARAILRGVDIAIGIISAAEGLTVTGEKALGWAGDLGIARAFFVNKLDTDNARFEQVVKELSADYSGVTPIRIPIGSGATFRGVINLLKMKAFIKEGNEIIEGDIPADMLDLAADAHNTLVENVAVSDEELMNRYLEEGSLPYDILTGALRKAIAQGEVIPLLCGTASTLVGVKSLLDALGDLFPGPADMKPQKGILNGGEATVESNPSGLPCAFVIKTSIDQFLGKLSTVRVFSGTFKPEMGLYNSTKTERQRAGNCYLIKGKEYVQVDSLRAGEIGAISKLENTATGDTLATEPAPVALPTITWPSPIVQLAVNPKTKADETRLSTGLQRLAEEDPLFTWKRDPETHETIVAGMGQVHVDTMLGRLHTRFNTSVDTKLPEISYKETIKGSSEVQGRHKKQSGGRGQFGDTWLRFEPLPRGSGFEFVDGVVGGSVPRNFIPAVEKGLLEAIERGAIAGYPAIDLRITLYDGSYHSVDSSEMAFKIAAHVGYKKGIQASKPVLLEPVFDIEVEVPSQYMGDIMGDLSSKRGKISATDQRGKNSIIRAKVPLEEIQGYSADLNSITAGKGTYSITFSHYDEVPPDRAQKIIEARKHLVAEEVG